MTTFRCERNIASSSMQYQLQHARLVYLEGNRGRCPEAGLEWHCGHKCTRQNLHEMLEVRSIIRSPHHSFRRSPRMFMIAKPTCSATSA